MYGGDGDDFVRRNAGDDLMYGGAGADGMNGGKDNDAVYGGEGADVFMLDGAGVTVTGGEGADTYYYPVPNLDLDDGADTITDFEIGRDEIEVGDEELTFDDIFLSQEDSTTVIAFGEVRIRY